MIKHYISFPFLYHMGLDVFLGQGNFCLTIFLDIDILSNTKKIKNNNPVIIYSTLNINIIYIQKIQSLDWFMLLPDALHAQYLLTSEPPVLYSLDSLYFLSSLFSYILYSIQNLVLTFPDY